MYYLTDEKIQQKEYFRNRFIALSEYVHIRDFASVVGIDFGSLSRFMNGKDNAVSLKKLESLDVAIKENSLRMLSEFYNINF